MAAILTNRVRVGNPDTGWSWLLTYRGALPDIVTLENYWSSRNCKVQTSEDGPNATLTVVSPEDEWASDYKDAFNIVTEQDQISIWETAAIQALFTPAANTTLEEAKKICEAALNQADYVPAITPGNGGTTLVTKFSRQLNAVELLIYNILIRRNTMPVKRPVIHRNRTIPSFSSERVRVTGGDIVYTTDQLFSIFNFPPEVQALVAGIEDDLESPPVNYIWGWWLRDDETRVIIGTGKSEENRSWVFGMWPTPPFTPA